MYFRLPLKDLIAEKESAHDEKPIRRIGDHCFIANGHGVIIRYARKEDLRHLEKANVTSCIYVIDDDWHAVQEDPSLPDDYRRRLLRFQRKMLPRILAVCDTVVAPNPRILRHYDHKQKLLLNPAPVHICKDFSHFTNDRHIRIVFAGTRSHLRDLEFLAPVMAELCRRHPDVKFVTFLGRHAPSLLKGLPNVHNRPPQPWPKYKEILRKERFHIGVAPYLDTPFNRARSVSKVLDHVAFGAASVWSEGSRPCMVVQHLKDGLCIENTHEAWLRSLERLIVRFPEHPRTLAKTAAQVMHRRNWANQSRSFWKTLLNLY